MFRETEYKASSGLPALLFLLVLMAVAVAAVINGGNGGQPALVIAGLFVLVTSAISLGGLFVVNPGDAKALVLFGDYKGTVKSAGFWFANPFLTKKRISLRVRNFETSKLKVNDHRANPIEIGAIVVWKVVETAEALFEVDDYQKYVAVQSESAVRAVATSYPYDSHSESEVSLSTHMAEVSKARAGRAASTKARRVRDRRRRFSIQQAFTSGNRRRRSRHP